jgi:O-antigen/teichoic acid export membrane protein
VFVSALQLNILVSLVLAVGLFLGAGFVARFLNNQQLVPVLRVIAVGVPAIPLMRVSLSGTRAVGRSAPKVIVQNLTHPLTRIAFVAGAIIIGATPVLVASAYVLSNWIGAISAIYFLARYTPVLDNSIGWTRKYREMLVFSVPLMATTGLAFILGNTDTLMLQYFLGSKDVGVYDIGYTIAQLLTVGVGSLSYLFLPNISSLHSEGRTEEIRHLYKLVTKWGIFITIPPYLIIMFFPVPIISVFGSEYAAGVPYLTILASSYFFTAITGPNKSILSAFGDTTYILYVSIFSAALNVVLNISLILILGTVGAAIASAVSLVTIHILYCFRLYNTYTMTPVSSSLAKPTITFVTMTLVIYQLAGDMIASQSPVEIAALLILAGAIYSAMILSLGGLQEDDVMLVRSAEQSLGIDLEPIKKVARFLM